MLPVKEKYVIDENGNQISVILSKKDYDRLVNYVADLEDIAAYDKAKKVKGKPVAWKKIKR